LLKRCVYNKAVITAIGLLLSGAAYSQRNYGVATSDWSVMNSIYLNPANIADSRERLTISLFSLTAGADNNLGSIGNSGLINSLANGNTKFNYSNSNEFSLLAPYLEVRGPGAVFSINEKHSVALTTGIRGINQFNNFSQSLYRTISDPNYTAGNNIDLNSNKFNYTAHLWSEVGLSYGGVVYDKGHNEIKVGATVRYLGGIGYVGLKGNNLDAHFKSGADSFYANNSDIEYASNVLSTKSALTNGFSNNSILSEFFGSKAGHGFGGDIGVTYDYLPDPARRKYEMDGRTGVVDGSANRYLFRVSASIVDIGAITYNSSNNSNATVTGNGYVTGQGLVNNVSNFSDFRNYVIKQGFHADTAHSDTKVYMPTSLLLSVDYHAYKPLYVNLAYAGNLANRQNFGNSYYSQVTITPRYDTRHFSVGLPVTYSMLSSSVKMGLGVRAAGFFVGSDDMLALFAGNQYGFNFYVGGCIPLYKKKISDRDGDHVSDRRDKCPDDFGTWENRGCPVEDKDADKDPKEETDKEKAPGTDE
jgi:hypothetical protein